jgi:cysteinyl-tRNA synthetase
MRFDAMDLKLYDTLTREKRVFAPLDPANVRMYVCGPTVYDFAHIGNARPVIVFDVLFRLLRHIYGADHVTYVRNITDVDDKINARAAEKKITIQKLTKRTYKAFKKDVRALRCLDPTREPRATKHIAEMRRLIQRLIKAKRAYVLKDHVLFRVKGLRSYGKLSHRSLKDMRSTARGEVAPKRNPMDFVLWKPSKRGEPAWRSPAQIKTRGRPGWHIECSAMSWKYLGEQFDIHGGGIDLLFPHHENERAQSCSAFKTPEMAQVWMHNGFLEVEGEKMSKSLGNFFTIRQLYTTKTFGNRKWSGNVLRFAMLQTHYRQPIDWTLRLLEQAEARLEAWRNFAAERTIRKTNRELFSEVVESLLDDLNTPAAFSKIDQVVNSATASNSDRFTVYRILKLLGLRGKQTRVAKTAANFASITGAVQNISTDMWNKFIDAARRADSSGDSRAGRKPDVQLVVMLDAIAEYWAGLGIDARWSEEIQDTVEAEYGAQYYRQRRNLRLLATSFHNRIRELGHFSRSDWNNFLVTVLDRPRFRSEILKPETKLFAYLKLLSHAFTSKSPNLQFHSPYLREVREKLLSEAKPAESEFEAQIRRLIAERELARSEKRYSDADLIRNQITAKGVVLKDTKDGTTWEIAR